MKKIVGFFTLLLGCIHLAIAQPAAGFKAMVNAPLPSTCMSGVITKSGTTDWAQYALKITNNCGQDVNMQNSSVSFTSNTNLNTSFWGNFSPLSYPDNVLQITSQPNSSSFISSLMLHFPEQSWVNTILHDKESFTLFYGTSGTHTPTDVKIYVEGGSPPPPVSTGDIEIINSTLKPANVTQNYAVVNVIFNGQNINTVQVPWGGNYVVTNLQPGTYTIQPQIVVDSNQNSYEGSATPATVTVNANQKVSVTLKYQQTVSQGTIHIVTPPLPASLTGYQNNPVITLTRQDTGVTVTKTLPWNTTNAISTLANNVTYQLSTPTISFQGVTCVGTFSPSSVMSRATSPLSSQLTYACNSVTQARVNIVVSGLPCEATSITVSFQPSDGSAKINKVVTVSRGSGTDFINLTDGVVYNVSTSQVSGYSPTFNPQPIMAKPNVTETIMYQPIPLK